MPFSIDIAPSKNTSFLAETSSVAENLKIITQKMRGIVDLLENLKLAIELREVVLQQEFEQHNKVSADLIEAFRKAREEKQARVQTIMIDKRETFARENEGKQETREKLVIIDAYIRKMTKDIGEEPPEYAELAIHRAVSEKKRKCLEKNKGRLGATDKLLGAMQLAVAGPPSGEVETALQTTGDNLEAPLVRLIQCPRASHFVRDFTNHFRRSLDDEEKNYYPIVLRHFAVVMQELSEIRAAVLRAQDAVSGREIGAQFVGLFEAASAILIGQKPQRNHNSHSRSTRSEEHPYFA